MVLQIKKLPDVVEACTAFRQCHTAAKCPSPPEIEGIGHSVPVTQNCLYRWIKGQLAAPVLHEQPLHIQHYPAVFFLCPVQEFWDLSTTISFWWKHLIIRDNISCDDGSIRMRLLPFVTSRCMSQLQDECNLTSGKCMMLHSHLLTTKKCYIVFTRTGDIAIIGLPRRSP